MALFSSKTQLRPCYDNDPYLREKKELEKLKMELEEVVTREEEDTIINKKIARIKKLSTAISRTCVQLLIVHLYARGIVSGVNNLIWTYLPKSCIFVKNII